jgi:putative lipoprotein (rSAM/lipoprotein system)
MNPFKTRFIKICNLLLSGILAMLGFSCVFTSRMEYGMPSATFRIKGKITSSSTNQPIKKIKVVMSGDFTVYDKDSVITGNDGMYDVNLKTSPWQQTFYIRCADTDGSSNGAFEASDTTVDFKDPQFHGGDGDWYEGVAEKEINVKLKPGE